MYFMLRVKVAVWLSAPSVLAVPVFGPSAVWLAAPFAVFGGSSLTLGRRKLIPSLEQVTCSVPRSLQ